MSESLFLSEEQTARILGVHRTTLRRSVDAGLLPLHPIFVTPHLRRFRRDEVESLRGAPASESAASGSAASGSSMRGTTGKGRGRGRS